MQSISAVNYAIHFNEKGYSILNEFIFEKKYSSVFILVDSHTNELCLPIFLPFLATDVRIEIIEIDAGESMKNIETCVHVWTTLNELGADRKSLVINLGGGVITDIGGFIASTYKRGIDFINIPTTLLGMVDASVGGKNGVDLGNLKNQIGTINPPKLIVIDTQYLKTLSQNELRSGLAEMLKHGLIYDKLYWEQFLDLSTLNFNDLDVLIYRSIEIKNEIVSQDLTENGIRKILNFGHTLGHSIESHFLDSKKALLHGEAIAVGMVLESYISMEQNLLQKKEYEEIKNTITSIFSEIHFSNDDISNIINLLIHDKKNEYGNVLFVLLNGIGNCQFDQTVSNDIIYSAFQDYVL